MTGFAEMWAELTAIGRSRSGGYRRFAWTAEDAELREWFASAAAARGLDVTGDRAGNQWAWWGDPDAAADAGRPGTVLGSHLDSVPDGGAFDGPLGVVSAFLAVDALRGNGIVPTRPLGIVNFRDEEGARFGVACAGSRLLTGTLDPDRARSLRDADGTTLAEAMRRGGHDPSDVAADSEVLRRVGTFVELHIEQGRGLADLDRPVAVGSRIRPHGRWRFELAGEANHAGTTRLADRRDPMITLAAVITEARRAAENAGCVATVGKVSVRPNGVNAIPSAVTAWLDARGDDPAAVASMVTAVGVAAGTAGVEESYSGATAFHTALIQRCSRLLGAPVLATGAGHDAGVVASAGVPATMLFVRNPTGVSHSPKEYAEAADCEAGVRALATVAGDLLTV